MRKIINKIITFILVVGLGVLAFYLVREDRMNNPIPDGLSATKKMVESKTSSEEGAIKEDIQPEIILESDKLDEFSNIIIKNARIITNDSDSHEYSALVIEGDKIVYVGDDDGALKYKNANSKIFDEGGNVVFPGHLDGHMHFATSALTNYYEVNLEEVNTIAEYQNLIRKHMEKYPDNKYCLGFGWDIFAHGENDLNKSQLDEVSTEIPIVMMSHDLHAAWANTKAVEELGIKEGEIGFDGYLKDNVAQSAPYIIHKYTKEEIKDAILNEQVLLNSWGITGIVDVPLALKDEVAEAYYELSRDDLLTLRVRMEWVINPDFGTEDEIKNEIDRVYELSRKYDTENFKILGFKFFSDQVLEQGTAYMLKPTTDGRNTTPFWDKEELKNIFMKIDELGMQIHVHQIGDGAARYVLDILEEVENVNGKKDRRPTFVHCQFMDDNDKIRAGKLGVNIMVEPVWAAKGTSYDDTYVPLLGEMADHMYPMKSLIDAGVNIGVHSDYIITPPYPLLNYYCAITRGGEQGVLPPEEEAINFDEISKASTINTAYSMYIDDFTGSIEVGKKADLLVTNNDFSAYKKDKLELKDLLVGDVEKMIFDGKILFNTIVEGNVYQNSNIAK